LSIVTIYISLSSSPLLPPGFLIIPSLASLSLPLLFPQAAYGRRQQQQQRSSARARWPWSSLSSSGTARTPRSSPPSGPPSSTTCSSPRKRYSLLFCSVLFFFFFSLAGHHSLSRLLPVPPPPHFSVPSSWPVAAAVTGRGGATPLRHGRRRGSHLPAPPHPASHLLVLATAVKGGLGRPPAN
jgi:hypothetical protein